MNEESLFASALDKATSAERQAFLERVCAGDDALRRRVEHLLAADEAAAGVLDRGAAGHLALGRMRSPDAVTITEGPGSVIGRYKLKQQIGEGGFGLVFVAEQLQPVCRKVAVKVIKPGMDTREVIARFEAERQALALMDHPNISQVLDAGATDSGRPYFVMELVRGVAITEHCDQNQLPTRDRLALFVAVCQAVQHAHQKGIIHRDIKPSNVLVAVIDGKPVVKVIDFGVAKALDRQLTDHSIYTGFAQLIGTPAYMSPEQAKLAEPNIDTRTDVYSLGVLLYELLTGTTPFDPQRLNTAGFDEIRRIIREEEPPRPSTRISTLGLAATTTSANRRSDPKRLSLSLRGELDWIVMKALEKDRTRRYDTANGLAGDVQRYLRDEPVEASPPSTAYRLKKTLRRHRGLVLAASIIMLVLVGGVVGTTAGLVRAEYRAEGERRAKVKAEEAAAAERDARLVAQRAERAAREAEADTKAFSEFLVKDVLAVARPVGERGGRGIHVTVRQALDVAQEGIGSRFRDRPRAESVARHALGVTFRLIGEPQQAEPHLRRAVELRAEHLGHDHEDTLSSRNSLGVLLTALGKHSEAVPLLDETLRRRRAMLGSDHDVTLVSMDNLASSYYAAGKIALAVPLHKEALKVRTATLGAHHADTLVSLTNLARAFQAAKKLDLATPLHLKAFELTKAKFGPDHPMTLATMNNLAANYYAARRCDLATPLFDEVHKRQKAELGSDHPDTLTSKANLASCYRATGKLTSAVPLYEEALELQRDKLGPDHPDTLLGMYNLALAYRDVGKPDRALPLFRAAAAGVENGQFVHQHADQILRNFAGCLEYFRHWDQAEAWRRKLLTVVKTRRGAGSPWYASDLVPLGANLLAQKRFADAEPVLRECLAIRERTAPAGWSTANTRSLLGAALSGQQKYAEAESLLLSGYQGLKPSEAQPRDQVRLVPLRQALQRLIQNYDDWGKPDEAARWREKLAHLELRRSE